MTINWNLISPCGLYCGVCAIYLAHRDHNQKFKERLVGLYKGEVPGKGRLPNNENLSAASTLTDFSAALRSQPNKLAVRCQKICL